MVLLAHPGTQYSLNLARELYRLDNLDGFHTCLAVSAKSNWARLASPLASILKVQRQLQNRLLYDVPASKLHCYPGLELEAWWRMRERSQVTQVLRRRNDAFQMHIPKRALDRAEVVIGFDTSSQILARRAHAQGKKFILDRSIAHPRSYARLVGELRERFDGWDDTVYHKTESDLQIEDKEHELAHLIVVPSRFVAETLISHGVAREKIRINPFGTDLENFHPATAQTLPPGQLIFLFVGALQARKGLPLLLEAWHILRPKKAQLWIAGTGQVPVPERERALDSVRWLGAVSREKLPNVFRQAHVFVFPSYFEGLAQVQLEAAACGLPIIATTASGGEEIVEEGKTGFIIEPGNLEQLVHSLSRFIEDDGLALMMGERAHQRSGNWGWSAYGERWQRILEETI
jgi:starch synthase